MENFKDYYKILCVSYSSTTDEIKKAYHGLVKKFHSDLFPKVFSLKDFLKSHETNIKTLRILNPEEIIYFNGKYLVLSDSLVVPQFMNSEELQKRKTQNIMKRTTQKVYKK